MIVLEKLKIHAVEHWLILRLFVSGVFASGFHAISVVTVLYFPLLLYYTRKRWYNVITATLVNLLSYWISTLGLSDIEYGEGKFQHPGFALVSAVNTFIMLVGDSIASRHPSATLRVITFPLLSLFGGAQNDIYRGSFFQVGYPEYVPKTIPVGCVLGPEGFNTPLQMSYDRWTGYSASIADAGSKLILLSEEAEDADSLEEETILINKSQSLAQEEDVYLVITYARNAPPNVAENKLVLITPQGDVAINYSKSHHVPIVEPITAGKQKLQFIDTPEFGRVGAAKCYDYNFPWLIRQASDNDVDVMLQPSWTWDSIGTYHGKSNSLRPVENGSTLVRCALQGVSRIYEPTLKGIFSQQVAGVSDSTYIFHLPIRRRWKTLVMLLGFYV